MVDVPSRRAVKQLAWKWNTYHHWRAPLDIASRFLLIAVMASVAVGQSASGGPQTRPANPKPVAPAVTAPLPQPIAPPAEPRPRTPEELPPHPPEVSWDGKQLSISSENSTLAAILTAVRGHIHASIDIPPGAGAERVAVQLGPAPAREVLTSLLSGSGLNYVIEASDTDEDLIQRVLLSPIGKADDSMTTATVSAPPGARLMPGYKYSSRGVVPNSQLDLAPDGSTSEPPTPSESGAASQDLSPAGSESVPAAIPPSGSPMPQAVAPDIAPAEAANTAGTEARPPSQTGATPGSATDPSSSTPSASQMGQELQRMYQQRKQIQMQQNQSQNQNQNQNQNTAPPPN